MIPKVKRVDVLRKYMHVRFREPYRFSKIRIPGWAERVSTSVSKNSKVKMGRLKKSGNWKVQSVLITKKYHSNASAKKLARKIVRKIEK